MHNKKYYILFVFIYIFGLLNGQTYKSKNSEIFLSLDWRSGFFHLYCNSLYPMSWSGIYSQKQDTFFCIPCIEIIDTTCFKYDGINDSIRQFVFIEKEDMLMDITRKNAKSFHSEWFDSLYITNEYYDKKRYNPDGIYETK